MGRDGAILTPNELVLTFGHSYDFASARRRTDTHTDTVTVTDANRLYNLSHAVCYSYRTNNNSYLVCLTVGMPNGRNVDRLVDNHVTLPSDGKPCCSGRHCGHILPFSVVGIPSGRYKGPDRLHARMLTQRTFFFIWPSFFRRPAGSDHIGLRSLSPSRTVGSVWP